MRVAILGCGPAGMMAAHAVAREQHDFDIISSPAKPSVIGGAQFLHVPIPGLTEPDPDGVIAVIKRGTAGGYAAKIRRIGQETSWETYEGWLRIWNLQDAYRRLWLLYSNSIVDAPINPHAIGSVLRRYDVVISTIPKYAMCQQPGMHRFEMQTVWIRSGEDLGVPLDCMIYDGLYTTPWYRSSHIFGNQSREYPDHTNGGRKVDKPLWNDCDCHPEIFMFGRYGKWEKRWLTHDAYIGARDTIRTVDGGRLYTGQGQAQ